MEIFSTLLTSIGLGVGAGVNAYATFLVFGLLSRFYPGMFEGELASFFAQTPVLIVLGVLYTVEFVADKVPAVDHVWDVIHTFIRPIAGGVVALAAANPDLPKPLLIAASIVSGGAALGSHLTKASVRATSTVTTGGVANPVLSFLEDIFAVVTSILALLLQPIVFAVIGIVLIVGFFWMLKRLFGRPAAPAR